LSARNILLVIPRFYPKSGGGVNVVFNVAKFLKKNGENVTILTTDFCFDEFFAQKLVFEGIEIIKIKTVFTFFSFIYSPEIDDWLQQNLMNYDIVHLNWTRAYQNNVIMKYALKYNIPYVIQPHGSMTDVSSKKLMKRMYDLMWGKKLYSNASKFIALTSSEKNTITSIIGDKDRTEIIPNGIDLKDYEDPVTVGEFRNKWNIGPKKKIILYVGRIHESKGLDKLILSLSLITSANPDILIVIAGADDHYLDKLEKMISVDKFENNVLITGYLSEKEKYQAFVDSDVFVTPKFFGFPITFIESWFFGLPVVTTDVGDSIEWIDDYVGYSVKYNENALAESIMKIIENEDIRERLSKNGKGLVRSRLNWEFIITDIIKLYRKTIIETGRCE